MSDNLRRYCDIHAALRKLCRHEPKGNHARHLTTLALLISGIVGSKKCQLTAVATKAASGSLRESRIKRLTHGYKTSASPPKSISALCPVASREPARGSSGAGDGWQ